MSSFTGLPISVNLNTVGNVINLTGIATVWAGTPFSITGVSGCSITSTTIFSATSARITLNSGPQIGIIALTDGVSTSYISVTPVNTTIVNQDNFHRANTALGGVGGGTTDILTAFEIAANQLRTTSGITGNLFTGRLYWPTQFADGVFRAHFGPGTATSNTAVMLFARAQGIIDKSQAIGFYVFPGVTLAAGEGVLFSIPAGSDGSPHSFLSQFSTGTCPAEGWMELITSGPTMTGNVYQADGVTLVGSITYTGLTGTYLSPGYAGVISFNFNNIWSEYDAWETISISVTPPFMPLNNTTAFAVLGQATNFAGSPFTISGVAGCAIVSQVITDATHATVTISSSTTAGSLLLTDTLSGSTYIITVTAIPSITLTPNTFIGSGTVSVAIKGINTAFFGTPFLVTGTPTAAVSTTTIVDNNNAVIGISVGTYAGIITVTDTNSGASATLQLYHTSANALSIGAIGDSITFGTNGDPVGTMKTNISSLGYAVTMVNRGSSGTTSGAWATNTSNLLTNTTAAFTAAGVKYVQIMLGTNDAKVAINTSVAAYLANMTVIVNAVLATGAKVILNQPIWTVPGSVGGIWLSNADTLYQQYYNALAPLVNNSTVFYGDTLAFDWFENNPSHLADGVHPSPAGNLELGEIWTYAFLKAFGLQFSLVSPSLATFTIQQVNGIFTEKELVHVAGSAFWIGMERIGNQRDKSVLLYSAKADIYNSAGTHISGPNNLTIAADETQPPLQKAGVIFYTGGLPTGAYRVVYTLTTTAGEVGVFQQTFFLRANPF